MHATIIIWRNIPTSPDLLVWCITVSILRIYNIIISCYNITICSQLLQYYNNNYNNIIICSQLIQALDQQSYYQLSACVSVTVYSVHPRKHTLLRLRLDVFTWIEVVFWCNCVVRWMSWFTLGVMNVWCDECPNLHIVWPVNVIQSCWCPQKDMPCKICTTN